MNKKTKIWLVTATSLVIIGLVMFAAVIYNYNWDFSKLNTGRYETNTYEISEEFSHISINADTSDIVFALSQDSKCNVVCYEQDNTPHSVTVKENTLTINQEDNRKWYEFVEINFSSPKITVYLPKTDYTSLFIKESTGDIEMPGKFKFEDADIELSTGDVNFSASCSKLIKIKADTGKIHIENTSVGALNLSTATGDIKISGVACEGDTSISVSTGKTDLTDFQCKNLTSDGNTGDMTLKNVIATEHFTIHRTAGKVQFKDCDASEIFVQTETGDVTGSLLTNKIFLAQTDTGNVNIPKTTDSGRCEIITDTGDIKISIEN